MEARNGGSHGREQIGGGAESGDLVTAPENIVDRIGEVVLVDSRPLVSHCFSHALRATGQVQKLAVFESVHAWGAHPSSRTKPNLVVYFAYGRCGSVTDTDPELTAVLRAAGGVPVVVIADDDDPDRMLRAIESGARGYIPTNVAFDVAFRAMRLVAAGGTFAPVTSLLTMRRRIKQAPAPAPEERAEGFTTRQTAVLKALREGKANKIIAYELSMRESTVKVHVRNIMKKVKARNRTEVAYKTTNLFAPDHRS
jgi:DNA-binding NarL/FixJ family response regulator